MRDAKVKAERDRANAAAGRTDAKMRNVVISEKWDKKAAKYSAGSLPFPYDSKEVYESSIRQPLGREVRGGKGVRATFQGMWERWERYFWEGMWERRERSGLS